MAKPRILIAEPDYNVGRMLQIYLDTTGYEVQLERHAADILKIARLWQPGVIFISTQLVDLSAFELGTELRQDSLTTHIPQIMLLHLDDRHMRLRALEIGADDVIVKPIDIEELRLRLEATIRLATIWVEDVGANFWG